MFSFEGKSLQISQIKHQIQPLLSELKTNSSHISDVFYRIFTFFLGTPDSSGALEKFGVQFAKYQPREWAGQLEQVIQYLSPDSQIFSRLHRNKEARITLNSSYLPSNMDLSTFQKETIHLDVRITYQSFSVPLLDAFFVLLAQSIFRSQTIDPALTQFQELTQDELFSSLSQNPLLVLLRKHLFAENSHIERQNQKLVEALRLYLLFQIMMKYDVEKSKSSLEALSRHSRSSMRHELNGSHYHKPTQLKFRLKVTHIHCLMLLLNCMPEYLSDFPKICLGFLQYFSDLHGDLKCFCAIVRAWIYFVTLKNKSNVEAQIIKALEKANSDYGWFILRRESPRSINVCEPNIGTINVQIAQQILSLADKENRWSSEVCFFVSMTNFFQLILTAKVSHKDFWNSHSGARVTDIKDSSKEQKIFKKIFTNLNENSIEIYRKIYKTNKGDFNEAQKLIEEKQEIIEEYIAEFFKTKNNNHSLNELSAFRFKKFSKEDINKLKGKSNIVSLDGYDRFDCDHKQHLVSFYRRDKENPWRAPVQSNEWVILYYLFFALSKGINLVIPGKRDTDLVSLRWLANPVNCIGLGILVWVIFMLWG